jgi:dTDP-4-dehydrorhamnose reductase
MVVLVTGASGQLGQALQFIAPNYAEIKFHFYTSSELNITDLAHCKTFFDEIKPDF